MLIKQTITNGVKVLCLSFMLAAAGSLYAQQNNSVPLDHPAYEVIEMGILRGAIVPPIQTKPWSELLVKEKLAEMTSDVQGNLLSREIDIASAALALFERKTGFDSGSGRHRVENGAKTFETGLGWESFFSVSAPDAPFASINMARLYLAGDIGESFSWNFNLSGGFLYIDRKELGTRLLPDNSSAPVYEIQSQFFYSFSKQWDGGVLLPSHPNEYQPWPDAVAFAWAAMPELNAAFFDQRLYLRMGRVRREWGHQANGSSLVLNGQGRPFAALEGNLTPLSWLGLSVLTGGLESFREQSDWPENGPFKNAYSMGHIALMPVSFFYFDVGAAALWPQQTNLALFANMELRVPGFLRIWGGIFADTITSIGNDFTASVDNAIAYQIGLKSGITWLPLAAVTLRYTKIEPYCYTQSGGSGSVPSDGAYINGGESLGHYLPPNSAEFLVRLESLFIPTLKGYVQFQMIQHGAEYGYGAVPGSSLQDSASQNGNPANKYWLMDGVYSWNSIFKFGASLRFNAGFLPLSVYAEAGLAGVRFSKNGTAGVGIEADYEFFSDDTYTARTSFIFSLGFKIYP